MKRALWGMAMLLCWCSSGGGGGGSTDYAPNFAGTWKGTLTLMSGGQTMTTDAGNVMITETGVNVLGIPSPCFYVHGAPDAGIPDLAGTVSSATSATFGAYTCPAGSSTSCTSVVQHWDGITGSLSGTTLSLDGTGTFVGCSVTQQYAATFVGSH